MKRYTTTLTIAGSDNSGGAGLQADLKTFSALGCYGMSVITALTAQNTQGVQAIYEISPAFIGQQIDSIFNDIEVDAIKIGMLHSVEIITIVAEKLRPYKKIPIILDPVMVGKDKSTLLKPAAIGALRSILFPLATLITPNLPEAETIVGRIIYDRKEMEKAAVELSKLGPQAVLVKGGHLSDPKSADCLYLDNTYHWFTNPRIGTSNTHGTGCTLSAAIAAFMAKGYSLQDAVKNAKAYISIAIEKGSEYKLGHGYGPVHHFYHLWDRS